MWSMLVGICQNMWVYRCVRFGHPICSEERCLPRCRHGTGGSRRARPLSGASLAAREKRVLRRVFRRDASRVAGAASVGGAGLAGGALAAALFCLAGLWPLPRSRLRKSGVRVRQMFGRHNDIRRTHREWHRIETVPYCARHYNLNQYIQSKTTNGHHAPPTCPYPLSELTFDLCIPFCTPARPHAPLYGAEKLADG